MAQTILFRGAIGGYNKADVNRYIARTDESNKEEKRQLQSRIDTLQKELDLARTEQETAEARVAALAAEKEALAAENETLTARLADMAELAAESDAVVTASGELIESLKEQLDEKEQAFAALQSEHTALASTMQQYASDLATLEALADKAKRYDEMSREYGSAILDAKSEASAIVSDAHKEADDIKNEAVDAVQEIKESAHRQIEATLEGTDLSFKNLIMNFIEDYTSYANKLHADLDNIIAGAKNRVDGISYSLSAPEVPEILEADAPADAESMADSLRRAFADTGLFEE